MTLRVALSHYLLVSVMLLAKAISLTGFTGIYPSSRSAETAVTTCFAGFSKGSGGFGSGRTEGSQTNIQLSKEAKKLLKKHGNNVDAASSDYFQSQMGSIQAGSVDEIHEARVTATWDTIAMFLPQDYARSKGKVEVLVERRLKHVVTACQGDQAIDILDVGCGDGAIVPYLPRMCNYNGMDLSTEMIGMGQQRYPGSKFWVGSFPRNVTPGVTYDAILFNGSLQFFRDTRQTLQDVANLLKPGGRIVLSHINGGKFVTDECKKNPMLAVRNMPNNVNINTMATILGLKVIDKAQIFEGLEFDTGLDGNNDDFYLVILQKPQ